MRLVNRHDLLMLKKACIIWYCSGFKNSSFYVNSVDSSFEMNKKQARKHINETWIDVDECKWIIRYKEIKIEINHNFAFSSFFSLSRISSNHSRLFILFLLFHAIRLALQFSFWLMFHISIRFIEQFFFLHCQRLSRRIVHLFT